MIACLLFSFELFRGSVSQRAKCPCSQYPAMRARSPMHRLTCRARPFHAVRQPGSTLTGQSSTREPVAGLSTGLAEIAHDQPVQIEVGCRMPVPFRARLCRVSMADTQRRNRLQRDLSFMAVCSFLLLLRARHRRGLANRRSYNKELYKTRKVYQ